ncbi:helix-turn-helix domain-containing protein [Pseudomonas aeruginosa]
MNLNYNLPGTTTPSKARPLMLELPQFEFSKIETTDVSQQADALPKWDQQYLQISQGEFHGSLMDLSIGPIQLFRESMNKSVDQHGQPWPNSFVIGVPINIDGEGFWSGDALEKNSIFTLRANTELKFKTPKSSDIFVSVISLDLFEYYSETIETVDPRVAMALNGVESASDALCHAMRMRCNMLFSVAQENPEALASPAVKRALLNDFMTGIFEAIYGLGKVTPHQSRQNVHRYIVERARDYILWMV